MVRTFLVICSFSAKVRNVRNLHIRKTESPISVFEDKMKSILTKYVPCTFQKA